jgi:signal transduction histidine kinase/ligand-binding sensor domain-containing protein
MISQYIRDHWGSDRGFTGGAVSAIAQTADGYLWIGTERGLIRFDGFNFRTFQQATPTTFAIGPVQSLVADSKGDLWILLQNTRILRYHAGKFELGREGAEFGLTSIVRKRDGSAVFASLTLGTLIYEHEKFQVQASSDQQPPATSRFNPDSEPSDVASSRWSWATGVITHRFAEPNSAVIAIAETSDGKLWLGTRDKGLFYKKDGQVVPAGKGTPDSKINCLLAFENQELWVGTDKGLVRWDGEKLTSAGIPVALRQAQVLSMIRDSDSNIWVGTAKGLLRINGQDVAADGPGTWSTGPITALFEDREGDVWVGSSHGIERLRDSAFVTYVAGDLQSESSGPIYVDPQERVWFAPFEGGLHWMKGEESGKVAADGLAEDVVYSIAGSGEEIWVGRQRGGLTRIDMASGKLSAKTFRHADGLAQDSVYAVHEGADGTVWAGTLSGGVSALKNGHFTSYTTANGMSSNTISSIAETTDGAMWFATPNGINVLQDGHWRVLLPRDGLPSENVNAFLPDSQGVLWIGTAAGLALYRAGHVSTPANLPESLQEQIFGIADDRKGWLWISTANHVIRVPRDKLLSGGLTEADAIDYGLEDGLRGIEGVKRNKSVLIDSQGKIWFSMNRGLSVVDPARASRVSAPAFVHIEGMMSDGNPVGLQGPVRIGGAHRRITFNFAALSLSVPERVRFKYKLDGVDEGWSGAVAVREVTYNNLDSGSYKFRVIASNSDGRWNSVESELPFEIKRAYWQTWWFRLSTALALGLAILLLIRLRVRALSARLNIRFEERLAERTRIAQELHDTLLQGFLSASMQLHVANERLPADSPAKPMLGRVLELMTRVIDEGRNTVRGLRSPESTNETLEESFSHLQQELSTSANTRFRVIVEGNARPLRPGIRDEIYFIGREALVNAFRHSGATEIAIEIEYAANHLRILVHDDGCGIDPHVLHAGREGHWGLSGMRERAERIGARLRVLSRAAAGTEIELSVPSRIVFAPQQAKPTRQWLSRLYSRKPDGTGTAVESEQHD